MAIAPVGSAGIGPVHGRPETASARPAEKPPFMDVVEKVIGDANAQQHRADQAVRELGTGQKENLHDVMLAVAKADLTFRMILEVRNRLTDAYQEVMRMQV